MNPEESLRSLKSCWNPLRIFQEFLGNLKGSLQASLKHYGAILKNPSGTPLGIIWESLKNPSVIHLEGIPRTHFKNHSGILRETAEN